MNKITFRFIFVLAVMAFGCGCHTGKPKIENAAFTSPALKPRTVVDGLKDGNERFRTGRAIHPLQDDARRKELTAGQHPDTIVVSCSDSRVPPEILFDAGLGEIFTVRTAGEVVDPIALASIEYAVEHLGAKLIVVMGHEACGAVKATLATPPGKSAGSPSLDKLLAAIRPNLKGHTLDTAGPLLLSPVKANADGVASHLVHSSEIIHEALSHRKIRIVSAVYHLDSGEVEFWNE